jgi:hypothetical protein
MSWVLDSNVLPAQMNLLLQWLHSTGQPMGGHAYTYQAFPFQEIDLVDQGSHLRGFQWSGLFAPSPMEFRESSYEGREARFMVLIVEPCSMSSPERILQRKVKKSSMSSSLLAYATYDFVICSARLVFQEEIILSKRKFGGIPK